MKGRRRQAVTASRDIVLGGTHQPAARGANASADAGRVRGPGAPPRPGQAAARGDRARRAGVDDLLGTARQREDDAGAPRGDHDRAGVRPLQRGHRRRAAHPRDRGRGPRSARGRRRRDHPLRGRDPPAQQGAAGQPPAALGGRHDHADRCHDGEPELRDQRRAALAHPGVRAPAAGRRATSRACSGGRWRTRSAGWAASTSE